MPLGEEVIFENENTRWAAMTSTPQKATRSAFAAIVLAVAAAGVCAQQYPTKPVRVVVASAPGGGIDTLARLMTPRLSELLGQPVIVDNRTGGGQTIGYEYGMRAPPDGYTLTIIS